MALERDIEIEEFLKTAVAQLRTQLDQVQRVVDICFSENGSENGSKNGSVRPSVLRMSYCSLIDCPHRKRIREEAQHTIEVLEATRSAFKSKEVAELRRRWTKVLKAL